MAFKWRSDKKKSNNDATLAPEDFAAFESEQKDSLSAEDWDLTSAANEVSGDEGTVTVTKDVAGANLGVGFDTVAADFGLEFVDEEEADYVMNANEEPEPDEVEFEEVKDETVEDNEVPAEEPVSDENIVDASVEEKTDDLLADEPVAVETKPEEVEESTLDSADLVDEAIAVEESDSEDLVVMQSVSVEDDSAVADNPADEVSATEIQLDDASPIAAAETPVEESAAEETQAPQQVEGENADGPIMDEEYMKAFMEEAEFDDFIYGGAVDFDERQDALDRIADNAEALAEEGIQAEEQRAAEEAKKEEEQRFNENGEPIDKFGKVILKRTLENKICLAETRERRYYNRLKNEILSYDGVKCDMNVSAEVFRQSKKIVARLSVTGNATRIYFALNPMEYDTDRYKQADSGDVDFDDTAMMMRVRNDDEFAIAVELLALMMGQLEVNKNDAYQQVDFLRDFPRREDAVIDAKGKMLAGEAKDEAAREKERRAAERRAAGLSEEPVEEVVEEVKEELPPVILPINFDNKLHQTTNTIKLLYSKIKNELLSYRAMKAEMGEKSESFHGVKKKLVARMAIINGTLRLYLALDPKDFAAKKYKHRDASDQKGFEDTPLMVKLSNEAERKIAITLITEMMKKFEFPRNKSYVYTPFAEKYPYIKNGVFKGDEDKPRVDHSGEEYADIYGELTEHLRSQMGMTDAWGVPKGYKAEDGLSARDLLEMQRSKAKTLNAAVALASPVMFFYDVAINEDGMPQYINVQQVLNDKFLGKMLPQQYFAMAESSERIEELNYIALSNVVKDCNENPELPFVVKISCRLLLKQETLTKLVEKMQTNNKNLILAFDCAMLESLGLVGISALNTLKTQGARIMIDNAESASMRVLTEYEFDYLRIDARYYDGASSKRLAHLDMITGYADVQNIATTSINCEHPEDALILLDHGVKMIQGDAVARPMRLIPLAMKNIKPLPKRKVEDKNGAE